MVLLKTNHLNVKMIPGSQRSDFSSIISTKEDEIAWFHGRILRSEAEAILKSEGNTEGLFLIRESSTSLGDYVLSLVHDGEAVHYQIRRHGEDAFFSIDDGPVIHGLEMLVEWYQNDPTGLSTRLQNMCKGKPPPADCRINGRTNLLHRATREGDLKVVSELLKSGYRSIDAKNLDGQTAVHLASILGHHDILLCLVEAGANISIRDSDGLTPLHYACQMNHSTAIRMLVDNGNANVQARSSQGSWVPLHEASSRGFIDCVKMLLALNAPNRPRTDEDATPYDLAIRNGQYDCARLLENYESPPPKTNATHWFHGNLSREETLKILQNSDLEDGTFLVRRSSSKNGIYVLSMVRNRNIYNFEILQKDCFYFIDDGPYFESLEHVIAHYCRMSDGLPTNLSKPLKPTRRPSLAFINPICSLRKNDAISKSQPNLHISNESNRNLRNIPPPPTVEYIRRENLALTECIGEGEFGSVMKGTWFDHTGTQIEVAVKSLRNEHMQVARDNFLREASVMIDLHHPCIVKLIGLCLGPPLMMVQELVPLGSLLDCVLDCPDSIDVEHLQLWASQIARGMSYLEQMRFVHRDLAARNILLASMEQAKITDFGLSRALGVGNEYYRASQGGRWPVKWYAPESVNFGTFSHASDVWSYGVTLWEMYSYGKTPYGEMTGVQVIEFLEDNQRLNKPERCPENVYRVMLQCWSYRPESRPTFSQLNVLFEETDAALEYYVLKSTLV